MARITARLAFLPFAPAQRAGGGPAWSDSDPVLPSFEVPARRNVAFALPHSG